MTIEKVIFGTGSRHIIKYNGVHITGIDFKDCISKMFIYLS